MCAAAIGSTSLTSIVEHTSPVPGLMVTVAVPLPSRSPWFGTPAAVTSASPVSSTVNGTPPVTADAGTTDASNSPADATSPRAKRRTSDMTNPQEVGMRRFTITAVIEMFGAKAISDCAGVNPLRHEVSRLYYMPHG